MKKTLPCIFSTVNTSIYVSLYYFCREKYYMKEIMPLCWLLGIQVFDKDPRKVEWEL